MIPATPPSETGLPWWVRAATLLGVPSLIALYLLWFLTSTVTAKLDRHMGDELRSHALLRQICLNTARTPGDARACIADVE